jgi:hypothetical protein
MITIINTPISGSTVQDDLWHIVTSDNSGVTDFKYVYDVYIGGDQKIRVKQFPEPSNGKGYFDAGAVVRNYMTYEWLQPLDTVYCVEPNDSGEMSINYDVRYGEDYTGLTYLNLASGTTRAYNWRAPVWKRRVETINSKIYQYLTNRPLEANADLGTDRLLIPFYTGPKTMYLTVRTYDGSNALVQTYTEFAASGETTTSGFMQLNLSPSAINNRLGLTAIDAGIKYYEVQMYATGDPAATTFRVNVVCTGLYTPMPLHFLNAWGMFDTARFDLARKLNMDVERKGFQQRDYEYKPTTVQYYDDNNMYRESKINHGVKSSHNYKIVMDAMSDANYVWLAELMMSTQIFLEYEGYFYPVTIKGANYDYSTIVVNRMKALEIEIEINQPRYSHLR